MEYNANWNDYLKALYHDAQGDWDKAHDIVDRIPDGPANHIHAYLHRKEGDGWNARYWYNRAKHPVPSISLDEEWQYLWDLYESYGRK